MRFIDTDVGQRECGTNEYCRIFQINIHYGCSSKYWDEIEPGTIPKNWNRLLISDPSQQEEVNNPEVVTLFDIQHAEKMDSLLAEDSDAGCHDLTDE